nr:MAG TPA: hypothetical protein [Caudoviricetes sp.]
MSSSSSRAHWCLYISRGVGQLSHSQVSSSMFMVVRSSAVCAYSSRGVSDLGVVFVGRTPGRGVL